MTTNQTQDNEQLDEREKNEGNIVRKKLVYIAGPTSPLPTGVAMVDRTACIRRAREPSRWAHYLSVSVFVLLIRHFPNHKLQHWKAVRRSWFRTAGANRGWVPA